MHSESFTRNPDTEIDYLVIPIQGDLRLTEDGKLLRYEWSYKTNVFGWFLISPAKPDEDDSSD